MYVATRRYQPCNLAAGGTLLLGILNKLVRNSYNGATLWQQKEMGQGEDGEECILAMCAHCTLTAHAVYVTMFPSVQDLACSYSGYVYVCALTHFVFPMTVQHNT